MKTRYISLIRLRPRSCHCSFARWPRGQCWHGRLWGGVSWGHCTTNKIGCFVASKPT